MELPLSMAARGRKWLPALSNCTGHGTPSCFDDPRVEVLNVDAFKWFKERFGDEGKAVVLFLRHLG